MTTDMTAGEDVFISWIHFGDLHVTERQHENYQDLMLLVKEANQYLTGDVDFAFLPGDQAEDGTLAQFRLVQEAINELHLPWQAIVGDHDVASGSLDGFKEILEPDPYRAKTLRGFRLLFLNALDGIGKERFDIGDEQAKWLEAELSDAKATGLRPVVFMHLYPGELAKRGSLLAGWIKNFDVGLVEMGHTHYNELANDGHTIYATTRSTGQIEEGPPGFSFTAIDGDVVSWKFKELGVWPLVMITSPAEQLLITRPESPRQVVRGVVPIRAKVWGAEQLASVTCSVDNGPGHPMDNHHGRWQTGWDSSLLSDGLHRIVVEANTLDRVTARDEISVLVNQAGVYVAPARSAVDYENAIGAHALKSIAGTQLGPNENGTKGPWPSWRGHKS